MIVTCPACQTRYLVDEAELGGEAGRRVRCASCGNLWHFSPEAAAIQTAVAEATAEVEAAAQAVRPAPAAAAPLSPMPGLRAEPGTQAQPRLPSPGPPRPSLPRPVVAVELRADAILRAAKVSGLGLILLVAVLVLVAILARGSIMAIYPPVTHLYAVFHMGEPSGPGLEVTSSLERTSDSLLVAGTITNAGAEPRPLARLRVTLLDGSKGDLQSRIIDPPVAALPPGATAPYRTIFENPSITAAAADVSFATE